jgi:hypothetical protein
MVPLWWVQWSVSLCRQRPIDTYTLQISQRIHSFFAYIHVCNLTAYKIINVWRLHNQGYAYCEHRQCVPSFRGSTPSSIGNPSVGSVGNITVYIPQPALGRRVQGLVLLYNQCYVCYVNGLHTEVTLALWLVDPITFLGRLSTPSYLPPVSRLYETR